jgi:hypothetical protein
VTQLLARVTLPIVLLVAAVALVTSIGTASIVAYHVQSTSRLQSSTEATEPGGQKQAGHPCNHGFYVSQAAHAHKGGAYVSTIAQSDLGKNGSCTAPLPAQTAAPKQKSSTND